LLSEGGFITIPGRHDVCDKLVELMPGKGSITYVDELRNHGFTISFTTYHNSPWYLVNEYSHLEGIINRDMNYTDPNLYLNTAAPLLQLQYSTKKRNIAADEIIDVDSDDESINTVTENEIKKLSERIGGLDKVLKYTYKIKNKGSKKLPEKESISSGSSEGSTNTNVNIIILFVMYYYFILLLIISHQLQVIAWI